jgi:hypothetical protein
MLTRVTRAIRNDGRVGRGAVASLEAGTASSALRETRVNLAEAFAKRGGTRVTWAKLELKWCPLKQQGHIYDFMIWKIDMILARTLIVMSCFFFIRCSDSTEELGGNYVFINEGENDKFIISHLPGRTNIYGKVLSYDFNEQFIIAKQQPVFNEYKSKLAFDLRDDLIKYPKNSLEDVEKTEELADSILRNDPFYKNIFSGTINFWIIIIKSDSTIGPLTLNDYLIKRKKLNIPDNVHLRVD